MAEAEISRPGLQANLLQVMELLRKQLRERDEDGATVLAALFTTNELALASSLLNFLGFGLLICYLRRRVELLAWSASICSMCFSGIT